MKSFEFFKKLIEILEKPSLKPLEDLPEIEGFIRENGHTILTEELKDKTVKELLSQYFPSENVTNAQYEETNYAINPKTLGRLKRRQNKNGIPRHYHENILKMPATEELYNKGLPSQFANERQKQPIRIYLELCYQLHEHTLFLPILETVLLDMKQYKNLSTVEYWKQLKKSFNKTIDMEISDFEQGDLALPAYSFNREKSLLKVENSIISDKKYKRYQLKQNESFWPPAKPTHRKTNHFKRKISEIDKLE